MPEQQTTTQKVLKNTSYNLLLTIISKIGGLIFTIIVARFLFPELFGIYSIALTVILTIATFTDLGINSTLIRYLAESLKIKTNKTKQEARSRFSFLFNFKIILTAIVALLLFLLAEIIAVYVFNKPLLTLPLRIGAVYLFIISLQGFFSSVFYSLQKVNYSAIAEAIFQVLRIALVLVFFKFYSSVDSIFVILTIAIFISFVFLYIVISKNYDFLMGGPKFKLNKSEKSRLLSFFGWLTISSISLVFFVHIDTFMLGIFLPAEFAGYYNSIVSIIGAVSAFVAFGSVLLPVFTQLEQGKLERGFKKVFHYTAMVAIPAAIGLAYVTVPAVQVIFGPAYVPASYKLVITITSALLSFLIIEIAFTSILSALFQAKEKPKIPALLVLIATITNIILNYIFIKIGITIGPEYGLIAVALATVIARYGNLIALSIITKKENKMMASASSIIKPLIASIIMLAFLFVFDYFVNLNILTGIIMIILAALVYLLVMFAIKGITKEDLKILYSLK